MLGLAAVNTGNNLIYLMVAGLLALLIVSGFLGHANLRRLEVRLSLPEEIHAGMPTTAGLRLTNRRRRLPLVLLSLADGPERAEFTFIAPGATDEQPLTLSFARRGRQRLAGLTLSSPFPVGFFERRAWLPLAREVIVLPRPLPCPVPATADGGREAGEDRSRRRGQEGDLLALSDYRGGEPLKLIHWKQSARQDRMKVKHLAANRARPLWIRLEDCPGADLEERLTQATYLVHHFWRSGRPLGLRLGERSLPPGRGRRHRLRLLHELALYDAP
ncbi:DUF58 domain-containing protein [Geoalkalibacter sp.]|uniref:DUF58 domain-containing protein n=1 Tax=Geoalkalibacter sp. TaxID=3041440 RepID=UPI00272E5922|nr:DUF58 domain-containing protein [Geoalkalibacter sp.]